MCSPNPCKHNGTCIEKTEENTFMCNCDDVGYAGKTCNVLLINVPEFSALAVNSPIEFSVSSYPDREFILYLEPDNSEFLNITPSSMMFSPEYTHYNVSVNAKKQGKYTLKYKVNDQTLNYKPVPSAIILATNGNINKSDYFDKYGAKPGVLHPGCYSNQVIHKCESGPTLELLLNSTCSWTVIKRQGTIVHSAGIIFGSVNKLNIPIAIAGAKVRQRKSGALSLTSLSKNEFDKGSNKCNNGSIGNGSKSDTHCSQPLSINDIQSFLCHESLASTYFSQSSKLTPKWLKFKALSSNRTHDIHSYIVKLVNSNDLTTISECSKLTTVTGGLYSVMLYSGSLKVLLHRKSLKLHYNQYSVLCFAVNLCEGDSSPLYIAIPDEVQLILQSSKLMRNLKNKGWTVTINSVVISDSKFKNIMVEQIEYWNGKELRNYKKQPRVLTDIKFSKLFAISNNLKANWAFIGKAYWFHDNINQVSIRTCVDTQEISF